MTCSFRCAALMRLLCAVFLCGCCAACGMLPARPQQPVKQPPRPVSGTCLTLALPASGQYAPISSKVDRGARMALAELTRTGSKVRLVTVDSEAPDWLQRLDALPPECVVVGGPLHPRRYAQARAAGLLEKRAFFTFLASLEGGDEGVRAWRHFPSAQDQIDALLDMGVDQLHIRTYGAFYPSDAYGTRMTELLEQSLAARNILLRKAAYDRNNSATWRAAVAPLIDARIPEGGRKPVPQTAFEALFLPDSWRNMPALTSSLRAHGEERLVLLGTTLWEQSLSGKAVPQAKRYALAMFPCAWNPAQAPAALRFPDTDLWTALGYDFVRFGATLGLTARPSREEVNERARRAAAMRWSMAPMSWDANGVAHQKLFVFGVTAAGMAPVDATVFQQTRARVLREANLRLQGGASEASSSRERGVSTGESLPEPEAPPSRQIRSSATDEAARAPRPAPVVQPAGAVGTTPRSSYKLSLPQARP